MDPNEINNRNQINRVVTPIKVGESGNPITNTNNNVVIVSKNKSKSSLTTVFVVIFLLLLALISYLVLYIIIPEMMSDKKKNLIINRTTTTKSVNGAFNIVSGTISDSPIINTAGEYIVSNNFKINVLNNGNGINVLVNNRLIDKGEYLHNNVALVHDLILITITNGARNTKLYAVTEDGEVVYKLYNFNDTGMIINSEASIQYNSVSMVINSTRIIGTNLIFDSTEDNINGLDICNYELLADNNIDDNYPVISNYSIKYLGNHQFSKPTLINSVTLGDYRYQNNYCTS